MTAPAKAAHSKEWCIKMAELEGNSEIGAGSPDHPLRAPAKAAPMREYVTQADRDAGAALMRCGRLSLKEMVAADMEEGRADDSDVVQAFARHRLAHTARSDAGERDVERVARAIASVLIVRSVEGHTLLTVDCAELARAALAAMREGVDRGMVERIDSVPGWLAKVLADNDERYEALPVSIKRAQFSYVRAAALSPEQPR